MAKKKWKKELNQSQSKDTLVTESKNWFVKQLDDISQNKYGRRMPEGYEYLISLLKNPKLLIKEGKKFAVRAKDDKNFNAERMMEDFIDDFSPEERYQLIPKTYEDAKILQKFERQIYMEADEDTIWRKITGYGNLNHEMIAELAKILKGKKVLEIMAGNGLLSCMLRDCGIEAFATDIAPNQKNEYISMQNGCYCDVVAYDAVAAIKKYGANRDFIMCSWPPHEEDEILRALKAFTKVNKDGLLIYIGEWKNGFNATDEFFDSIQIVDMLEDVNKLHLSHIGSKDVIRLVKYSAKLADDLK